jgi:hypothetical protein
VTEAIMKKTVLLCFIVMVSCHHSVPPPALPSGLTEGALIEDVQVRGNRGIPAERIKAAIQTKALDRINLALVSADVHTILLLGCDEVHVEEADGASGRKILIINIKEKLSTTLAGPD